MAAEADRLHRQREKEEAWQNKQRRIAEAREREEYRARVTKLANESTSKDRSSDTYRRRNNGKRGR